MHWWPGDGSPVDIVGGNDGYPLKGSTFASGKVDQAFSFDGVDDTVALAVPLSISTAFTISVWVSFDPSRFDNVQEIFNNNQFFLRKNSESEANTIGFFVKLADGTIEPRVQSRTVPETDAWYHIAATWDGSTSRVYINGVSEGSSQRTGTLTAENVGPLIGAGEQTSLKGNAFSGLIDELAIFNRALSASEVRTISDAGSYGMAKPTSTVSQPPTLPSPSADRTWFAPNMGSLDYSTLFDQGDQWQKARAKTDIFKFYTQNVMPGPCEICGDNILKTFVDANAFRRLMTWGVTVSVEIGTVKPWGCTGEEEFRVIEEVIYNITTAGGRVSNLAMDEPLIGGQDIFDGLTCGYTMEHTATVTAQVVERVQSRYSDISIGDIEPYPHYSVSELEAWVIALAERGFVPEFFHLDIDVERVRVEGQDVAADLRKLKQFLEERGIVFGVIFISNWRAARSDLAYYESTMDWVRTVYEAVGKPEHVIFQSWQGPAPSGAHEVPINLPEDDPSVYSHTRLLLEGLALLDSADP